MGSGLAGLYLENCTRKWRTLPPGEGTEQGAKASDAGLAHPEHDVSRLCVQGGCESIKFTGARDMADTLTSTCKQPFPELPSAGLRCTGHSGRAVAPSEAAALPSAPARAKPEATWLSLTWTLGCSSLKTPVTELGRL